MLVRLQYLATAIIGEGSIIIRQLAAELPDPVDK
jgi:hypothetical protein